MLRTQYFHYTMAIDYTIDYQCEPRTSFGTDGVLERVKSRARANDVIALFRQNGDQRPPSEMGFEFSRNLPDGTEETRIIIVQEMLDLASELDGYAHYCFGCPANLSAQPFGCYSSISYPISSAAEAWLLDQLPGITDPLIWLLLREGAQANGYDGNTARSLRPYDAYFEEKRVRMRDLVEFTMTADQVFEMLFMVGPVQPAHGGITLLLFGGITRAVEAHDIVAIMNGTMPQDEKASRFPFTMMPAPTDDKCIREFKAFFKALHTAWILGRRVIVDA
ncbi:MAG: hypothetical protein KME04_05410 [Pleurocapsa minor GSE-CHR-MK-17-07R]|nr:hypothetical protein [Pleurocapsa minor GSE-CHR-MK 17-07R]